MFVLCGSHSGYGAEIFLDFLMQDSRAFPVYYSYTRYIQHDGIVDISCYLVHGVIQPLASYIKFRAEIQFSLCNRRAYVDGGFFHSRINFVGRYLAADIADIDYYGFC